MPPAIIRIDTTAQFELSPNLYMQFMEPLGTTDSSVEAAWDHLQENWRPDVVAATQALAPGMIRWGGILSSFYRWRESVGPRSERRPYLNMQWGGVESGQIGTAELVDFCRRVGAEPLLAVNFASDGRSSWINPPVGESREGTPREAAEWVAYCNQPDHPLRREHGAPQPYDVRYWQIGNETSYGQDAWSVETAAAKTVTFARAMREVDPDITLIGWGGQQRDGTFWAPTLWETAGDPLDMLAFHHMFNLPAEDMDWPRWREQPERAWDLLMGAWQVHANKIKAVRDSLGGTNVPLALTECHLTLPGPNRNDVLATWAAGVCYARMLNVQQRNGDLLKIATCADFCGNRWMVNAVMIPTPRYAGAAYLMPVASVMALFRHHTGERAVKVEAPAGLDVTASRTGDTLYLHVVNPSSDTTMTCQAVTADGPLGKATLHQITAPPFEMVDAQHPDIFAPGRIEWHAEGMMLFPPASVTAVEMQLTSGRLVLNL